MARVSEWMPVTLEAAEKEPIRRGRSAWRSSSCGEVREVDVAVVVLADGHDVGDRLAPGQLVGVVLEGTDEDDRALPGWDVGAQAVAALEVGRDAQVEDAHELVHGGRRARAAEDDGVLLARRPHGRPDDVASVLAEARRLQPRARRFGVRVGVEGHDLLADVVLDEGQVASARRVIGVGDAADAEGPGDGLVVPDDAGPDELDELVGVGARDRRG